MKKITSLLLVLCMSMTTWAATSSVPSEAPDVMLQAFYWDSYPHQNANLPYGNTSWQTLLNDSAELGEYFDLVWLPPTNNGDGTGYIPRQYSNLNSAFGSEADLRLLIGALKRRNSRAIADIVINHCGNSSNACDFKSLDFGTYGQFSPTNAWMTSDDEGVTKYGCSGGANKDDGQHDDGPGTPGSVLFIFPAGPSSERPVDRDGQQHDEDEFRLAPRIKEQTGKQQKQVLQRSVLPQENIVDQQNGGKKGIQENSR